MNKFKWFHSTIVLIVALSLFSPNFQAKANSFEVSYTLMLEQEDYPVITVRVQGFPGQTASFAFMGDAFERFSNLTSVFKDIEVQDSSGKSLPWQWGYKKIIIANGSAQDFTIRYAIDALNFSEGPAGDPSAKKFVVFRFRRIFFIAGNVFPIPEVEPDRITVDSSLPEGTSLYSSLPTESGIFVAMEDLWGDLLYDFQKAYFAGGHVFFSLTHTTEWGDEYEYLWFDRDPITEAWTPAYGNSPWEQAEQYMETAEACAGYFRDTIGPLSTHRVLFTNVMVQYEGFPSATTNQDWFHYMQIWPRNSEPEVCHHIFHQYSFFPTQSRMPFGGDPIGQMLTEGLSTYYEQVLPSLLYDDPRFAGKLFEFYVMDERGAPHGIRSNTANHVRYNRSALKVYLLDQYIRSVTGNSRTLDDFVRSLWELVQDNPPAQQVSETNIREAFVSVVGEGNTGYLYTLASQVAFDPTALGDLQPSFAAYVDWMSQEYFWGYDLLFYVYLDIASAKGNEWPHFATYPHNIPLMRPEALQPFWDYLHLYSGSIPTEQDILNAMNASTGRSHAGFFEFWESLGIALDPAEIADLSSWDPSERSVEDALPSVWESIGTLKTDHLLRGIPQDATIFLDAALAENWMYIEIQCWSEDEFANPRDLRKIIMDNNVTWIEDFEFMYQNIYIAGSMFQVKTEDPEGREYPITLTYPSGGCYPRFGIHPASQGEPIGFLYFLGPLDPITLDLINSNNIVLFPDTALEDETYLVSIGGGEVKFLPGEDLTLSLALGSAEVFLLDQYGYIRGQAIVEPVNANPIANFNFDPADPSPQTTVQFTDASLDSDGQITTWRWDFGDGSMSEEKDPVHIYSQEGSYTVILAVVDDFGGTSSHEEQILVSGGSHAGSAQGWSRENLPLLIIGGVVLVGSLAAVLLIILRRNRPLAKVINVP